MAGGVCGLGSTVACLTDPPPDLPGSSVGRPEIVGGTPLPPEGLLTAWPADNIFRVPIDLPPDEPCAWSVYVDGFFQNCQQTCNGVTVDGGVITLDVPLSQSDLSQAVVCPHVIKFTVAPGFESNSSCLAPDPPGGDTAIWYFEPDGSCFAYDAGALEDGAFPPTDAETDTLPLVPESGGDP